MHRCQLLLVHSQDSNGPRKKVVLSSPPPPSPNLQHVGYPRHNQSVQIENGKNKLPAYYNTTRLKQTEFWGSSRPRGLIPVLHLLDPETEKDYKWRRLNEILNLNQKERRLLENAPRKLAAFWSSPHPSNYTHFTYI